MYEYKIRGEDYLKGKVQKIGQAIAVTVDKDWLGKEVIVVKEPELAGLTKRFDMKPKVLERTSIKELFGSIEKFEEYVDSAKIEQTIKDSGWPLSVGFYLLSEISKIGYPESEFEELLRDAAQIRNMNPGIRFDDLIERVTIQAERNKEAMDREKRE